MSSCVMKVYNRFPIQMVRGDGVLLFDINDKQYLDFISGIATVSLGHCHPYINERIIQQISCLHHCSNIYTIPEQERLAQRLADLTFADQIFFCSSGAESVDAAIKFMRRYHYMHGRAERKRIITLEGGFHGRSMAAISAGGSAYAKEGYAPLLEGFDKVPKNDLVAFEKMVSEKTAGVLLEPVQAEGGIHVLDDEYLEGIRNICKDNDIVLCFDEVQCGYGRTGSLFRYQDLRLEPDILVCAKAMGNGFPIAGCLTKNKIADVILPGTHGSTYGGNPLAMVVGNAVLDIMLSNGFFENARLVGEYLGNMLRKLMATIPDIISSVRGIGCLWGLELCSIFSAQDVVEKCLNHGLLISRVSDNKTLRLAPPLVFSIQNVDDAIAVLYSVLSALDEYKQKR